MARLLWNLHHLHCCVEKHGCMKRNQQDTGANYWRSHPSRRTASVGLSLPLLLTFFGFEQPWCYCWWTIFAPSCRLFPPRGEHPPPFPSFAAHGRARTLPHAHLPSVPLWLSITWVHLETLPKNSHLLRLWPCSGGLRGLMAASLCSSSSY